MKVKAVERIIRGIYFLILIFLSHNVFAYDKAPDDIVNFAKTTLVSFGSDPVIVNSLKLANINEKPQSVISKTENLWKNRAFDDPKIKSILNSSLSFYLQRLKANHDPIEEVYLIDKMGLLIATAKFEEMYQWKEDIGFKKAMKGELYIGDVEIDEDEQVYMVHVALPVKDKDSVIGAINFGLLLGKKQ